MRDPNPLPDVGDMEEKRMNDGWRTTNLDNVADALRVLTELRGKRWLCRGQSQPHGNLKPSIDRKQWGNYSRAEKLKLERESINVFRSTAQFFAEPGEQSALTHDVVTLMVLRHYGVPTRLLDWSQSPWVAAYFAVDMDGAQDGEIWTFDEPLYERLGEEQWKRWPETTKDGKFQPELTAFKLKEPPDWFTCNFYAPGFHRQNAQQGAYTMTARFGRDHADAIAKLLTNPDHYHLYIISQDLKPRLREVLRTNHGIWRGSLYPDSAGAAETAKRLAFPPVENG